MGKAQIKETAQTAKANNGSTTNWTAWAKTLYTNWLPFMPDDWESRVPQLMKEGYKSAWRNKYFESICKMKQSTLKRHLMRALESKCYSPISGDGYLYAEGRIPVLLVAHMDTVHAETARQIIYRDEYIMSPQGIGGDDRCGVYMVLEAIKKYKCHVLFTEDEESGCIGATKFSVTDICKGLKGKINYIIEFDRKNDTDAVFYQLHNPDFEKFIESTKYFVKDYGSYSDICEIAPVIGAAAVNLSCGYYNPHTKNEYVNLKEMHRSIEEAVKLIEQHDVAYEYKERTVRLYSTGTSLGNVTYGATSANAYASMWDDEYWERTSDGREIYHCGDRTWVYEDGKWECYEAYDDMGVPNNKEVNNKEADTGYKKTHSWQIKFIERDVNDMAVGIASAIVDADGIFDAFDEFFDEFPYIREEDVIAIVNVTD